MVALLAGAVLYLWLQLRHYQRIDYGQLVRDEERERQTQARLAALERLVGDLAEFDRLHRTELAEMLSSSQAQLELQSAQLREAARGRPARPREKQDKRSSGSLAKPAAKPTLAKPEPRPRPAKPEPARGVLLFLRTERQWAIAARLRDGLSPREVARELSLSLHEVELVSTVLAGQRNVA